MNANPTPITYALRKPSQPSESQSPDASEGTPASAPLGVVNSPPPNGATGGLSLSQDVNEGNGETKKQIPRVSLVSSIIDANTNLTPIHYAPHKPS